MNWKIAFCTFRYDAIARKYESEWHDLDKPVEETVFISGSPYIWEQSIKYAVGKENVEKLYQEHLEFLRQNDKLPKSTQHEEVYDDSPTVGTFRM